MEGDCIGEKADLGLAWMSKAAAKKIKAFDGGAGFTVMTNNLIPIIFLFD